MTHDQANELLLDLAYGELAPDVAEELSRHAAGCAECHRELARIAAVRQVAARLDDVAPSATSRGELVRAARGPSSSRNLRTWLRRPATLSFASAVAVVAIVVGVTLKLAPNELGGAVDRVRGVPEQAAPGGASEPTRSDPPRTEDRREAPPGSAAPAGVFAKPPAASSPPVRKTPVPPVPAAGVASEGAAASARKSAERPAGALVQPSHSESEIAAPRATGAARAYQRAIPSPNEGGGLVEERRQLRCGDILVERVALVAPSGRIVKLTERRGEAVAERWYDDGGRRPDAEARHQDATGAPTIVLPPVAPTLEALGTTCAW